MVVRRLVLLALILLTPLVAAIVFGGTEIAQTPFYLDETLFVPHPNKAMVRIIPAQTVTMRVRYGSSPGSMTSFSPDSSGTSVTADTAGEFVIDTLTADTAYYYQLEVLESGTWKVRGVHQINTPPDSTSADWKFAIVSDSHYYSYLSTTPMSCDPNVASSNSTPTIEVGKKILSERPAFVLDIGDTYFCQCGGCTVSCNIDGDGGTGTGSVRDDAGSPAEEQLFCERRIRYTARYSMPYRASIPLVPVDGNHDGRSQLGNLSGGGGMLYTVLAARQKYYGNPNASGWYPNAGCDGGCTEQEGDYSTIPIGSAEIIRLNEYIHSPVGWPDGDGDTIPDEDPYDLFPYSAEEWSTGAEQLSWFQYRMRNTTKKWVFVAIHHLPGVCRTGRAYHYGRFCLGVERYCSDAPSQLCEYDSECAGSCDAPSLSSDWRGETKDIFDEAIATAARTGGAVFIIFGHDHIGYTWQLRDASTAYPVYLIAMPDLSPGLSGWLDQGGLFEEGIANLDSDSNRTPLYRTDPFWGIPVYVGDRRGTPAAGWVRMSVTGTTSVKMEMVGVPYVGSVADTSQPARLSNKEVVCMIYDHDGYSVCP